jgi:hypothetical protein
MQDIISIPHRISPGLCPVNGIRDLIQWRTGRDWTNEFVHGLGQGGGFAYLRINPADPPRQVYWGIATPRQHQYLAKLFNASYTELENRAFKTAWKKAQAAVDQATPPVLGPLDMFHLPWYAGLYHARHIPIHYLLMVGYDDHRAYFYDTGFTDVQSLPLIELQQAWDVNVPGLGKRNRLVILDLPREISTTGELIRQSIADQCQVMLKPPISMLGILAMKKLAREIAGWPDELGKEKAKRCFTQVREYLSSPPDIRGIHLTAGRDLYVKFLEQASEITGLDFSLPIECFHAVIDTIPQIASAIERGFLHDVAYGFTRIAELETQAFSNLSKCAEIKP